MQAEAAHERARAIGIEREMQKGSEEKEVSSHCEEHRMGVKASREL